MWYWWIILVVVAAMTATCAVIGACSVRWCTRPYREQVLIAPGQEKTMARAAYRDRLTAGADWLSHQVMEVITLRNRDGLKLYARLLRAKDERALVLAFHGYHTFAEKDFGCIAPFLLNAGYSILFVDQRAHGKSDGNAVTFGAKERYDCQEWAEKMAILTDNKLPVYLYGQSMGAATVLMASGLVLPDSIKGIVADCGFTSPAAIMGYTLQTEYRMLPWPLLPFMALYARMKKGFGIWECDTRNALRTNRIPVLLFHGTDDSIVPYRMGLENEKATVAVHEFCGMEHAKHCTCFFFDPDKYQKTMLSFLEDTCSD